MGKAALGRSEGVTLEKVLLQTAGFLGFPKRPGVFGQIFPTLCLGKNLSVDCEGRRGQVGRKELGMELFFQTAHRSR